MNNLFEDVSKDYDLGKVLKFSKVQIGYEDDNFILETDKGKYFVKVFGGYRTLEECKRYMEILDKVDSASIKTPKLFKYKNDSLYSKGNANLCVFEFIDGKTFYELGRDHTKEEASEIIKEAAKNNQIDLKPSFIYDEWAIVNILEQYNLVKKYLTEIEDSKIAPLVERYKSLDLTTLPHCFVHGDIITTNVMKKGDDLYIIDFACSNYCPRIIELAILACNILSGYDLDFIIEEYEKSQKLSEVERNQLAFFLDLAHAMHVIGAAREERIHGNNSKENKYWLDEGKKGLGLPIG